MDNIEKKMLEMVGIDPSNNQIKKTDSERIADLEEAIQLLLSGGTE